MLEHISTQLQETYGEAILSLDEFRNELTIFVKPGVIKELARYVKEQLGFDLCVDICGADTLEENTRFEVIYNLLNLSTKQRLRLKTRVDELNPQLPSVVDIWKSANWYERETYDMFGVIFEGHPDMRRIYMPEDFEYFPMRKEFPLIGIPGSIPLPAIEKSAQKKEAGLAYNKKERI